MERVGQYVIVRQLSVRAHGSIYRARLQDDADEQGKYLVKVFNPTGASAEEVAVNPQVQAALDHAVFQQKVVQSGAKHWAPIFEHGICEEGAYYVSLFYPSSIRRLVEGRVHLQSAYLRVIALGIVDGLIELKAAANRAHGNLSPQTVLIELNDSRQPSRVLLAEAGTDEDAAEAGERGDIKVIGQLLYQVITSRAKLDALILPLGLTEEWKYLGVAGKPWLDLINWLLDTETKPQTHSLEQVRQRITAISAGKAGSSKGLLVAAAAAVVLAGLAGGGWYMWQRSRPHPDVPTIVTTSKFPVAERMYKIYRLDPKSQQLLGSIKATDYPELAALRTKLEEMRLLPESSVTEANLKSLDDAIKAAKAWTVPADLRRLVNDALPREWEKLGERIKAAADAGSADTLDIGAVVAAANWRSALADYDWKASREKLAGYAADFTKSGYPLLAYFEELPKELDKAASQVAEPGSLAAVRALADSSVALAGKLSQAKASPDLTVRFSRPSPEKDQVVKEADAEIAAASTARAQAVVRVLGNWEERMLRIPAPKDAAAIYEQYKKSVADRQKEYDGVKKWTLASEDEGLAVLVKRAEDNVEGLKKIANTASPEFQDAKDQADRVLRLLQSRIKEGEARRQLFDATSKSFAAQVKQIDELIPQAVTAGSTNGPVYEKAVKGLRDEASQFEQDFKTLNEGDVDARKKKLDDALTGLFRRIEEEIGTEPRVAIALPKFTHEAMLKEIAGRWDEYSTKVVGQTRPKITRSQKALLEPAKASIEAFATIALEMEKKCEAVSGLKVEGGAEIQAAVKALPEMALTNGTRLISEAIQIDKAKKRLTIGAADPLAGQDKWNKSAGEWLACWSEIEKALAAGTGSGEKWTPSSPQLAGLAGDVTPAKLREKADVAGAAIGVAPADTLKQLRARLKTLEDFEAKAAPANEAQRGAWLKEVLEALKTDKLELASAAARKISAGGAPRTVGEFKDLDAARKQMLKPAKDRLDKSLDSAVAGALSAFAQKGLRDAATVEATAKSLAEIKTSLALASGVFADDPAIKAAVAEYARKGLVDPTTIQATATVLASLKTTLGLAGDAYASDPAIKAAVAEYARKGLGDPATIGATATVLAGLKTTLGLGADAYKNEPAIKAAIAAFAQKGLKDAATVEATATALEGLKTSLGLAADVYQTDQAVKAALTEFAQKGLRNGATVETTIASIEKVKATMGFPPEFDAKDPAIRFNLALYRARQTQLKETDNAAAVALAQNLVNPDTGLGGDVGKKLVTDLQDQLAAWAKYQSQLGAKGGPKDAGFALNAQVSGDDVKVFEKKVGEDLRRLVFGRIMINGEPVFVCTTETPIWAVDALVEGGKKLGDLLGIDAPVAGNKPVPRPWFTDTDITELRIRPSWLPKYNQGFSPYPDALRDPAAPEKLATKSANPGKDQPLDWIAPDAAKGIATALGCRLATSAEWRAGAMEQANLPNLRDSSWEQVATQLNSAPNKESIIPRPCTLEKISFAPSNGIVSWDRTALAAAVTAVGLTPKWNLPGGGAYDDQYPFFWPAEPGADVNPGGKPTFRDLIGNVGEYVVDTDGQIHIAGGSALSDPADGLGVQKIAAADGIGYADVGLRLAFTPVKEGPQPEIAKNVKDLLGKATYVTVGDR